MRKEGTVKSIGYRDCLTHRLLTHPEDSQASGGGYTLGTMDDAATGTSDNTSGTEDKTLTDTTNAAPLKPSSIKCDEYVHTDAMLSVSVYMTCTHDDVSMWHAKWE